MFFNITKCSVPRTFHESHSFKKFTVHCDAGWHCTQQQNKWILYKGYLNNGRLSDIVKTDTYNGHCGNYCIITVDELENIAIHASAVRSFPLCYNSDTITNFDIQSLKNGKEAYADSCITANSELVVNETVLDVIGNCDLDYSLTEDEVISLIDTTLYNNIASFVKYNTLPLKVFLSGGLDSMLLYSYIKRITADFELLNYEYFDYDTFWCNHGQTLRSTNSFYSQLHHWKEPNVLVSGALGDEYTMRNPEIVNLYMHCHGVDIMDHLKNYDDAYHLIYFTKKSYIKKLQEQEPKITHIKQLSKSKAIYYICNMLINDYQHYHLGNTLTYTPFRDIQLVKYFMQLPLGSLIGQAVNGNITRKLIKNNDPTLLQYISTDKNSNECMANLSKLLG
jgi:hypothetical protein